MKIWLAIVFAALFAYPTSSRADRPSATVEFGVEDARERFRKGVELYREANYDAALAEFSKAYEIAPDYRVLYNLAQVQNERHDYAAAMRLVEDYLKRGEDDIAVERLDQVRTWLTELKSRVAVLRIQCPLPTAELSVDGLPVGVLPLDTPVLLNAGVHQLQVRKRGYETITREVVIAGGEKVLVELPAPMELGIPSATVISVETTPELSAPDEALGVSDDTTSSRSRTPLWISLISTAVLAGGAVTFGALATSQDAELDRQLDQLPADQARIDELQSDIKRNATLCDVFAVSAVVGAGVSLYFAITTSGSEKSAGHRPEKAQRIARAGDWLSLTRHF